MNVKSQNCPKDDKVVGQSIAQQSFCFSFSKFLQRRMQLLSDLNPICVSTSLWTNPKATRNYPFRFYLRISLSLFALSFRGTLSSETRCINNKSNGRSNLQKFRRFIVQNGLVISP